MVMQKLNTGTTGKAFRLILGTFLFAAVAGLVLTDMGGFFRDGGSSSSVAQVGRDDIDVVSFSRAYERTLAQSGLQDAAARQMGLPFMVLQQEITRDVLRQAAKKSGIHVSRNYVAGFLTKELENIPGPGTPQEKLRMLLQKQGLNEQTLVRLLREDSAIDTLVNATAAPAARVPDALAIAPWRAAREKRSAELVDITPAALKDFKKPDDGELQAYYDEHKENYRLPEKRSGMALVIPQSKFLRDVSVSDNDIQAYYDAHKEQFMTAPRVRFEQIIAQDKKKAEEIADSEPKTLEKHKGENVDYIPLDWNTKTTLPKEIAGELYPDQKTGLIGPIQTSLGWHVLIVEKYEDGKPRPFSEVKPVLARQLKDEKLDGQLSGISDRIDQMVAEGSTLELIGKEYGVKPVSIPEIAATDAADRLKTLNLSEASLPRVIEALFTLSEEEISPVQQLSNGDILLVQVEAIEPSVVQAFEKVKATVAAAALKDKQTRAIGKMAQDLIGDFDPKKPEAFSAVLQKANLARRPVAADTMESLGQSLDLQTAQILFSLSDTNPISFSNSENKVTLVILKSIQPEKGMPDDKTLNDLRKNAQQSFGYEIQSQFVRGWQEDLGVSVNNALMQRLFTPKEAQE